MKFQVTWAMLDKMIQLLILFDFMISVSLQWIYFILMQNSFALLIYFCSYLESIHFKKSQNSMRCFNLIIKIKSRIAFYHILPIFISSIKCKNQSSIPSHILILHYAILCDIHLRFLHFFYDLLVPFFLYLNDIPFSGCGILQPFTY